MIAGTAATAADAGARKVAFDIPAQSMATALLRFSEQTGIQITAEGGGLKALSTDGVRGDYPAVEALDILLKGSGLTYKFVDGETVVVRRPARAGADAGTLTPIARLAQVQPGRPVGIEADSPPSPPAEEGVPEILVKGNRSLNADIRRTEDEAQPYVVFDRAEVERSQARNLEEFLRTRLPMNASASSIGQITGQSATVSSINLRGLGTNQTLILIDGRRVPGVASLGAALQPDINGIPLSAIERIEVLPSTAGGIYGGSATGGVVNIIMRRDYTGLEAKANYANTFDSDTAAKRLELSGGFSLEGGRTRVTVAGTYSEANTLLLGDRDFADRSLALVLQNNPAAVTGAFSPPLGATPNIRSATALQFDERYGSAFVGSNITHIPAGYSGVASDNGAALIANAGRYNLELPNDLNGRRRGLVAAPAIESFAANARREFGSRVEAFLDIASLSNKGLSYTALVPNSVTLAADAPNNPFRQNITVSLPTPDLSFENRSESSTLRATAGVIFRLPGQWTGEADYGWSRSRYQSSTTSSVLDTAGIAALSSSFNILSDPNAFPLDFTSYLLPSPNYLQGPFDTVLRDATLRLSGPVAQLPGGALIVSAMVQQRKEELDDAINQSINRTTRQPTYFWYPSRGQSADSYYAEARVPLIGAANALPWARALQLQLSARHDRFETRGVSDLTNQAVDSRDGPFVPVDYATARTDSTDYTVGLSFTPFESLMLRASLGTGFLPPSITQIARSEEIPDYSVGVDPARDFEDVGTSAPYTYYYGGNSNLKPERSKSWSVGGVFTPAAVNNLRFSVDYTRIRKDDEIQYLPDQFLLDFWDRFPDRVVRAPDDPEDDFEVGPIILVDSTYINIARTTVDVADIQADYTLDTTASGNFHWYAVATRQFHYKNQVNPETPVVDRAGYTGGPLKWRGNFGLDWNRGAFSLGWNAQYYDSYFVFNATASPAAAAAVVRNQGSATIPRQIYHDVLATYRFGREGLMSKWLSDTEVSIGIQNLFDAKPPPVASTNPAISSSGYSTYGDPRLRRYSISLRKSFQ